MVLSRILLHFPSRWRGQRPSRAMSIRSYFRSLEPCLVGMEAFATAHYWTRELIALRDHSEADAAGLREGLRQAQQERCPPMRKRCEAVASGSRRH